MDDIILHLDVADCPNISSLLYRAHYCRYTDCICIYTYIYIIGAVNSIQVYELIIFHVLVEYRSKSYY